MTEKRKKHVVDINRLLPSPVLSVNVPTSCEVGINTLSARQSVSYINIFLTREQAVVFDGIVLIHKERNDMYKRVAEPFQTPFYAIRDIF